MEGEDYAVRVEGKDKRSVAAAFYVRNYVCQGRLQYGGELSAPEK